jgi:hypothetical protein
MNTGEIWIHKEKPNIELKILKYLKDNKWKVIYLNTFGDDGSPFDELNGDYIFINFNKTNTGN